MAVTTKDITWSRRLDGGAGGVTPMARSAAARRIARRASARPARRARRIPHEPPSSTPAAISSAPVGMKARAHGMGEDWAPCGAQSTTACTASATRPATSPPSEERTAKNPCAMEHTASARAMRSKAQGSRWCATKYDAIPSGAMIRGGRTSPTAAVSK